MHRIALLNDSRAAGVNVEPNQRREVLQLSTCLAPRARMVPLPIPPPLPPDFSEYLRD